MRADRLLLVLLPLAVACGPARVLTRPEGNGGWSETRRRDELERRATAAAVPLDPEAPPPGPDDADAPLSLGQVLALATSGNRRIAEAERGVDAAAARVRDTRGRLLPETIQTGRYNAYTDPLRNNVSIPTITGGNGETFGGPSSFVIRQQRFGRLNTTSTLPLDVTGQIWKTLTAAQAGYRGEARAPVGHDARAAGGRHPRVLRPARGAAAARGRRSRTSPSTASSSATRRAASTPAGSPRTSCSSSRSRCRIAEQELRRRDFAIDQARWRSTRPSVGRSTRRPASSTCAARPDLPTGRRGAARRLREQPDARALCRGAATSRGHRRARSPAAACRASRAAAPRLDQRDDPAAAHASASGFVGFDWDLGTDTPTRRQQAEARIAAEHNRLAIERELRELEGAVRDTRDAADERLAALDTARAAVGQAEENLRIRHQQFDVGRATSEDVLDAQAPAARQRAMLATALYQAHTRRAELQELMGLPLESSSPRTR